MDHILGCFAVVDKVESDVRDPPIRLIRCSFTAGRVVRRAEGARETSLLFQVGLKSHSIKTSEADLLCLSATVTTFHIHDLTLFHVCVMTPLMSGSMTTHHSNTGGPHIFRTGSLQHDAFPKCCSSSTRTVFTHALLADKRKGCRCPNHQEVILIAVLSNWKS